MYQLLFLCFGFIIIPTIPLQSQSNAECNALSPSAMGKLISSENPEAYPLVECCINDLIVIIQTRPDWSPLGQKRFMELVNDRYYDGAALFRAIKNFIVQFGLASTKTMRDKWGKRELEIVDDPNIGIPFTRGTMSFAGGGKNTRGTQIFFTLAEISHHLGKEAWETPFGKVIYGDDTLKSINTEYDDNVSQGKIWREGYDYLEKEFPNLSYIEYCRAINDNEISYYLQSIKKVEVDDKEHDLQQQLYEYADNETLMNNGTKVLLIEIIGGVVCMGAVIFALVKVLKKTPDKNN